MSITAGQIVAGGGSAEVTAQAMTYYGSGEQIDGVEQPQGALKQSVTTTTSETITTDYVYTATNQLNYYTETKGAVTKRFTMDYDMVDAEQINSITITTL